LCDPLDTFLKPQPHDPEAQYHDNRHTHCHKERLSHQFAELSLDLRRIHSLKTSCRHLEQIDQEPSADRCVEHHQQIISRNSKPFIPVPFCSQRLQLIK